MKHLVLVGACYLDTILTVPHFPDEDSKLRATSLQVRRGGNCPNTLEVFHQLAQHQQHHLSPTGHVPTPVKTHLISSLPSRYSTATKEILSSFDRAGDLPTDQASGTIPSHDIFTSPSAPIPGRFPGSSPNIGSNAPHGSTLSFAHCLYREEYESPASSYIVRSNETGSRTIINFNDLPEMTEGEFVKVAGGILEEVGEGKGCWWHFEGRIPETTLQCIYHLRKTSPLSTISIEVEKPGRDGLVELAAEADVVFYSRSWSESRGYASAEACLKGEAASSKAPLMLCTWGAAGASAFSPAGDGGGEYIDRRPASSASGEEIQVVDTVGAGDTFIAGMLYGLICHTDDWSQEAKLRFAVELATKKVQQEGFAGLGSAGA